MLSDYLDRDLPPETCAAIAAHLQQCTRCGKAADALRKTVDVCRQYRAENLPGPLPETKQQEMKAAFQKALDEMRERG
jgi:anti-sigma factor RsiW